MPRRFQLPELSGEVEAVGIPENRCPVIPYGMRSAFVRHRDQFIPYNDLVGQGGVDPRAAVVQSAPRNGKEKYGKKDEENAADDPCALIHMLSLPASGVFSAEIRFRGLLYEGREGIIQKDSLFL